MTEQEIQEAINAPGTYAVCADPEARDAALKLCRGSYQRDLVRGLARLSGAGLAGKARSYGGRYAQSRDALLRRLAEAGLAREVRGPNGRRVLVLGKAATASGAS